MVISWIFEGRGVDFREEIEGGDATIGDMKERDVKGGEILGGTNGQQDNQPC
jgi:hypothetical protein